MPADYAVFLYTTARAILAEQVTRQRGEQLALFYERTLPTLEATLGEREELVLIEWAAYCATGLEADAPASRCGMGGGRH
jgi:hypothetical protein